MFQENRQDSMGGNETPSMKDAKNFTEFLKSNPYAAGRKSSSITTDPKKEATEKLTEKNFLTDMKKAYEYFDVNKPQERKDSQPSVPKEQAERITVENSATFKKFATLDEVLEEDGLESLLMASATFFSPQSELGESKLDPAQKKMVEAMQKRILSLDQEVRRLKKVNTEYEAKVKKLSEQVSTFTYEKENFAKV